MAAPHPHSSPQTIVRKTTISNPITLAKQFGFRLAGLPRFGHSLFTQGSASGSHCNDQFDGVRAIIVPPEAKNHRKSLILRLRRARSERRPVMAPDRQLRGPPRSGDSFLGLGPRVLRLPRCAISPAGLLKPIQAAWKPRNRIEWSFTPFQESVSQLFQTEGR